MHLILRLIICLVSLVPCILGLNLTYNDVSIKRRTCFPSDSCHQKNVETASRYVRLLDEFKNRACNCDDVCVDFQDCCIDAKPRVTRKHVLPNNQTCVNLKHYGGVFMIDACPESWTDHDLRQKCENTGDTRTFSPISLIPVTDIEIGTTYRNYYCAICNNHSQENELQMWTSRIECLRTSHYRTAKSGNWPNFTREFILENLHYNETKSQWGLMSDSKFYRCDIDPYMTDNIQHIIRLCRQAKGDCAESWPEDEIKEKCHAYSGVVNLFGDPRHPFKNLHCAICNGFTPNNVSCGARGVTINSRDSHLNEFGGNPFSVLLDFNPSQGQIVGVVTRCGNSEVYDPFFRVCRNFVCGYDNYVVSEGKCIKKPAAERNETSAFVPTNDTGIETRLGTNSSEAEFQNRNCPRWELSSRHVLWLKNGSIYIEKYQRIFAPGEYLEMENKDVLICALEIPAQEEKFSFTMTIVTLAGMGISVICLILHLIVFMLVPDLQNLSGKNLACLVQALLVAYVSFITGMFLKPTSVSCVVISVVTYYSFLANFFWMNVIAIDVCQTLRMATTELRVSGGRQLRKFVFYSLYAWICPGICVVIALLLEYSIIPALPTYKPAFGSRNCWFGHRMALAVLFGGPAGVLLLLNTICFILSSTIILWSTRNSSKYASPSSSSRRNYKLYLRLAIICGLTWIWGFIAGFFDHETLWYIFILFNTLIGFFIFVTFTCTKKVKLSLRDRIKCWKKASKKNELFNISASGSNLNSNETRKSTLVPTDSAESNNSERSDGIYNPLASYKTNSTSY